MTTFQVNAPEARESLKDLHEGRTATMADDLRMAVTNLLRKAEMAGDADFLRDGVRILG